MDNTRTDISAYHIATNPDLFETQKTNAFKFIVTGLDNLVDPITGNTIANATDVLKQSTFSFDPPSFTQQPITVRMDSAISQPITPFPPVWGRLLPPTARQMRSSQWAEALPEKKARRF